MEWRDANSDIAPVNGRDFQIYLDVSPGRIPTRAPLTDLGYHHASMVYGTWDMWNIDGRVRTGKKGPMQ